MKRKAPFFVLYAVVLCLLTFAMPVLVNASQSVEQSANNAVEAFFNAGLHNNFNAVESNSIDNRPKSTLSFRRQVFDNQAKNFLGYQIQSVQKVDSTNAIVIVNIRQTDLTATVKYPVVFNGTKWLVDITHAKDATSDTTRIENNSQDIIVQPNVAQYGGTVTGSDDVTGPLMSGYSTYTVTGWQVPSPSTNESLAYQLWGEYWWGNWQVGSTKWVPGTYDTNNWFPAFSWSNVSTTLPVFLDISTTNGSINWYVGGNIYVS